MLSALLVVSCGMAVAVADGAPAGDLSLTDFQIHQVHPLVTPGDMRSFAAALQLPQDQQDVASMRYDAYIQDLEAVVQESIDREAELQNRLNGILTGRYRAKPQEVKTLRTNLEESKAQNWPRVDAALDSLIADTQAIGPPISPETVERAVFDLYRSIYLRPLRQEAADSAYAGEGLDFFILVSDAMDEELADADPRQVEDKLGEWRRAMLPTLRGAAEARRRNALDSRLARLRGDLASQIDLMIAECKRWSDRQQIDYACFVAIYQLCPNQEATTAWTARYRKANYPWLWKDNDEIELIADWIMFNGNVGQIEIVNSVVPRYLTQRDELRLEAEGILLQGRSLGANLCDDIAGEYQEARESLQQLMQNSGKRAVLMRQARAELEQPLSDGQRAAIRRLLLGSGQRAAG